MRIKAYVILGIIPLMLLTSCDKRKREKLREKLDAEFEAQTEELTKRAKSLQTLLDELIVEHEELDQMHMKLDIKLAGKGLSEEDKAKQKQHDKWDEEHIQVIQKCRELLSEFDKRKAEHEEMEEHHGEVPLVQIEEEHEEFEENLKQFNDRFSEMVTQLKTCKSQMETIFKEHEKLEEEYIGD
ncbi:hypothetical protein JXI42_13265 [bacterium]|nr:hypothetical protein [bacterium]